MKKLLAAFIFSACLLSFGALAADEDTLNLPIKQLRAGPTMEAKVVFDIPITVKLLDVSEDACWYKVKIAFALGPFNYNYVGWANLPIQKILSRTKIISTEIEAK